ncbi:hypothetical protein SXIM_52750 [Streptomyces xiamenensis]|uniref:Uncharacterized protein n=1 Tax=Streptomyces xiamenensis TaxID=408015 RepID=A0A0F7G1I6_9ACTN|nr:hypothetical protein SXIM_52750 [Streptomyces xiamenensis]
MFALNHPRPAVMQKVLRAAPATVVTGTGTTGRHEERRDG